MNRGMIAGRVYNSSGRRVKGAYVYVSRVYGGNGLLDIKRIAAYSDSDGDFSLPFVWDAWDSFKNDLSVISMEIGAFTEDEQSYKRSDGARVTTYTTTSKSKGLIRGVVRRDIISLTGVATSNFDTLADVADFGIDIGKALAHWDKLVPFWKVHQLASSENWLILGGANIYLLD